MPRFVSTGEGLVVLVAVAGGHAGQAGRGVGGCGMKCTGFQLLMDHWLGPPARCPFTLCWGRVPLLK